MTTSLTEGHHRGEFVLSELEGYGSRTLETLISGQNLVAGTVLGRITASGKMTQLAPAAGDGSETAAGVLFDNVDASGGDIAGVVVIERSAEVKDMFGDTSFLGTSFIGLTWPGGMTNNQHDTAVADLLKLGISCRP